MQPPIEYLPFDQSIFVQLVESFHIHPRITRTIGRDPCYFSIQSHLYNGDGYEQAEDRKGGGNILSKILLSNVVIVHESNIIS